MRMLTVSKNEAGQRLDKLLAKYLNLAGKSFIYKMMRKKNITLNGKKCDGSEHLTEGDEIKLFLAEETIEKFSEVKIQKVQKKKLDIVYEDEHILLINKPSGMLSQKAKETDESLVEYLIDYLLDSGKLKKEDLACFRPSVCNRLDRNTSGIVAAGRSLPGLQIMSEVIKDRSLGKYYVCVVRGIVKGEARIEGWLTKRKDESGVDPKRGDPWKSADPDCIQTAGIWKWIYPSGGSSDHRTLPPDPRPPGFHRTPDRRGSEVRRSPGQ